MEQIMEEVESWKISEEAEVNRKYVPLKEEEESILALSDALRANPRSAIKPIQEAIIKYPGNFDYYKLLEQCFYQLNEEELIDELARETYLQFPKDVIACTNYMNRLLRVGKINEFKAIIDPSFNIHKQFPDQKIFSPIEFLTYLASVINYYIETDEIYKVAAFTFGLTVFDREKSSISLADSLFRHVGNKIKDMIMRDELI